jgi:hypothetical protein
MSRRIVNEEGTGSNGRMEKAKKRVALAEERFLATLGITDLEIMSWARKRITGGSGQMGGNEVQRHALFKNRVAW